MALTDDLKQKLYLHLSEQDTLKQKLDFRRLLRENEELAQAYHQLRMASDGFTPERYKAQLLQAIEEAYTPSTTAPVTREAATSVTVISSQAVSNAPRVDAAGWFERLTNQLDELIEKIAMPGGLLTRRPRFQLAWGALAIIFFVGIGLMISRVQHSRFEADLLYGFGNFGQTSQGSDPVSNDSTCDSALKSRYFNYTENTAPAEIQTRITTLQREKGISETCRSFYLGRAYLWSGDYIRAITLFKKAESSPDRLMQDMAVYYLALSYFLADEKKQGVAVLNERSGWSDPDMTIGVENLKKAIE